MIMFIKIACCFLVWSIIISRTIADVTLSRNCDSYTSVTNFTLNLEMLIGEWYEVNSYTLDMACTIVKFTPDTEKSTNVTITGVTDKREIKQNLTIDQINGNQIGTSDSVFYILGTDYNKYIVIWNCTDSDEHSEQSTQNLWILTNENQLTFEKVPEVITILNKTTISLDNVPLTETSYDVETCSNYGGSASKSTISISILTFPLFYKMLF